MELATLIGAISAALKLWQELAGDDEKRRQWEARIEQARRAGAGAVEALRDLYEEVAEATLLRSQRLRAEEARRKNPAFWKGAGTLLLLALCLSATGCRSGLTRLSETEHLRAGYAYEWPKDASMDPADYQTTEVEGRMITTTPKRP